MTVLMVNNLSQEVKRIVGAFVFYSRIPIPSSWYSGKISHSSRYFSLVGWAVGVSSAAVWMLAQCCSLFLPASPEGPVPIASLLGIIVAVLRYRSLTRRRVC